MDKQDLKIRNLAISASKEFRDMVKTYSSESILAEVYGFNSLLDYVEAMLNEEREGFEVITKCLNTDSKILAEENLRKGYTTSDELSDEISRLDWVRENMWPQMLRQHEAGVFFLELKRNQLLKESNDHPQGTPAPTPFKSIRYLHSLGIIDHIRSKSINGRGASNEDIARILESMIGGKASTYSRALRAIDNNENSSSKNPLKSEAEMESVREMLKRNNIDPSK